jgi:hypothetical protein
MQFFRYTWLACFVTLLCLFGFRAHAELVRGYTVGDATGPTTLTPNDWGYAACYDLDPSFGYGGVYLADNSRTFNVALASDYGPYDLACETSPGGYTRFTSPQMWLWPDCESGITENAVWQTTIASGSTQLSFLPEGTAPEFLCSTWCVVHGEGLTYNAWVEAGHIAVGDSLWVEISGTLTGSACNPSDYSGGVVGVSVPSYVCPTTDIECTSGGGDGTGGGLDETDKANLAAIATNTGVDGKAAELLEAIKAQGEGTIGNEASLMDCTLDFQCTGDLLRCAEVTFARKAHCDSQGFSTDPKSQTVVDGETLFDAMKVETNATRRSSLSAGTVDVSTYLERPRILAAASCPTPETVTLNFGTIQKNFEVGFEAFCDLADIISMFLLFSASIVGGRIFFGGFAS